MKNVEQGCVIPFGMPGARLRRRAREYRRCGQALESLSLVRRAALQEDSAPAWQAVAAELRQMSCWESAMALLGRVLSRADAPQSAWLDMAQCLHAVGRRALAEDCLYHVLHDDPWSRDGETARSMLQGITEEAGEPSSRWEEMLSQRAIRAWHQGEHRLALRRISRAVRLSKQKAQLLNTKAMLHMMVSEDEQALECLKQAICAEPDNALPYCALAVLLHEQGRSRIARGMLRMASPRSRSVQTDTQFCNAAWSVQAWDEMEEFLRVRLARTPYRVPLLHAQANLLHEQGRIYKAQETWRLILAVDPEDRAAATLLEWTKNTSRQPTPSWKLPTTLLRRQRTALLERSALFTPGSEARRMLDWCVTSADVTEQDLAFRTVQEQEDREAESRWLQEVMARPDVLPPVRQRALIRLIEMQCRTMKTALISEHYLDMQVSPEEHPGRHSLWRMYLPRLLHAVGRHERCSEIVHFAAKIWPLLRPAEKQAAVTGQDDGWSHLFLMMWFWQQGCLEEAERLLQRVRLPLRRYQHVLQEFVKLLEKDAGDAGEGDT